MSEVPGTDRDQARENVLSETPVVPDGVQEDASAAGDEGRTGDDAKPPSGSTDLGA